MIDDEVADKVNDSFGILFHMEDSNGIEGIKGAAYFGLDDETGLIQKAFVAKENNKSGETNLKILNTASKIIETYSSGGSETEEAVARVEPAMSSDGLLSGFFKSNPAVSSLSLPEQYFQAWNERDMAKACSVFADDVEYDDTAFPAPFRGTFVRTSR